MKPNEVNFSTVPCAIHQYGCAWISLFKKGIKHIWRHSMKLLGRSLIIKIKTLRKTCNENKISKILSVLNIKRLCECKKNVPQIFH